MLDQWFCEDVDLHFEHYDRLVLIDEPGEYEFLLEEALGDAIIVQQVKDTQSDLMTKYEVEKNYDDQQVLIYSRLDQEDLRYCLEYFATNPTPENLQKMLHSFIQTHWDHPESNLSAEDYILLGKESLGKGQEYWDQAKITGLGAVLGDLEQRVCEFLHEPQLSAENMEADTWELFCKKLEQLTGQSAVEKPPATVADEFVHNLFQNILENEWEDERLKTIYETWINHVRYQQSLLGYVTGFDLPDGVEVGDVTPDHPFKALDQQFARDIVARLDDEQWLASHKTWIHERRRAQIVLDLIDINWWGELLTVLSPSLPMEAHEINSLDQFVDEVYQEGLYKIDRAIRTLYSAFMDDETLRKRLEAYYESLMGPYWNVWFDRFEDEYQPNQAGLLERIFEEARKPCAVVVGDAISFDMAVSVGEQLSDKAFDDKITPVFAEYPSTTEHNKTRLFDREIELTASRNQREDALEERLGQSVHVKDLSEFREGEQPKDRLILYHNDTDDIMEKLSGPGLQYIPQTEKSLRDTIQKLINSGYREVHVVSDHGFVFYGTVSEADKIPIENPPDQMERKDRFLATEEPLAFQPNNTIELEKEYKGYRYLYFARGLKPFRTPSKYGFAHGGIMPQELLIPHLTVRSKQVMVGQNLDVFISNLEQLKDVPVPNVTIKLKAGAGPDLMASQRKVFLSFYRGGEQFDKTTIQNISSGQEKKLEIPLDKMDDCEVQVLDAESRKTLDKAKITFEQLREGLEDF